MLFHSVNSRVPTFWDVKLHRWLSGCDVSKQLTYLRIPWSRVLLEKLTGSQLVKKFPAFYGT
jgi:hypothetical protein